MKLQFSWLSLCYSLLLFISISVCAQPQKSTYEQDWKSIQQMEKNRQTLGVLMATDELYIKIKKAPHTHHNEAELIKVLLVMNKHQSELGMDGLVQAIYRLEKEAQEATFPSNAILYSMLGELYNNYLKENIYKFKNRTTTVDVDSKDIQTWDLDKITHKIYTMYQASLVNKKSQTIALEEFHPILIEGKQTKGLRPTLYDFLLNRALDFYRTDYYHLTQPSYKFILDKEEDFATADEFIAQKLTAKDSLSPKFQAMLLFQEGLKFHQKDKDPAAFIDLNLNRLLFVYENSVLVNKDLLLEKRLKSLHKHYKTNPVGAAIPYQLAKLYFQQGEQYQQGIEHPNQWKKKEARTLCTKVIEQHPKSYGASLCKELIQQIGHKSINIQLEKIASIEQEGLASISYQNVQKLYFKVIPIQEQHKKKLDDLHDQNYVDFLNKLPSTHTWENTFPNEEDYQLHTTEIAIPALSCGHYIVAASTEKDFNYKNNAFSYANLHVSDLRLLQRQQKHASQYSIINAKTGKPVVGATIDFYGHYSKKHLATKKSDKNGFFDDASINKSNSYKIKITYKSDVLELDDNYYSSRRYNEGKTHASTSFFLDRAIYRPGQTIYFKGLVLQHTPNKKIPTLVTQSPRTVTLYDANYQKVADIQLTSNEYGTFNGSFTAPSSGLLGQMYLLDESTHSVKYFRVEEYKRPKFEVTALPIQQSYKLGDSVTIQGLAKAYAGNTIAGAKVSYRVVRQVSFPYWNWRWGWFIPYKQEKQQMAFGTTTTNEKGEYSIVFKAQADQSIPAKQKPSFTYYIYADVVDITGETHSSTSTVQVGYIALDLNVALPTSLEKGATDSLLIHSKNLNGQFEAAKGNIRIERLKTPTIVYKKRYWKKPDLYSLDEVTFKKKFPYFAYKDEDKKETWAVEKTVLNTTFDTKKSPKIAYKGIQNWLQGDYKVTIKSQDKYGEPIELVRFFTLYDQKATTTPSNQALYAPQSFDGIEPNTTLALQIGSANLSAYVLYEVEHDGKIVYRQWLQPKGIKKVQLKVLEKHRGNLHFHLSSIQKGHLYTKTTSIYVPWSNKKLAIEYASFRDKLAPGQKETWTLKIKGADGEKVSAELLASMYDASLDAFAVNQWNRNFLITTHPQLMLEGYRCFTTVQARVISQNWNTSYKNAVERIYPAFDWHGFPFLMRYRSSVFLHALGSIPPPGKVEEISAQGSRASNAKAASIPEILENSVNDDNNDPKNENTGNLDGVNVRTNLNETVFFFPELKTDKDGNLLIQFTMNEALTRWKFQLFGHTKDFSYGYSTRTVVTQKDLMIVPNAPRFFREGDAIHFTAKVSNLTKKDVQGTAQLLLLDAITLEPLNSKFGLKNDLVNFKAKAEASEGLSWKIQVPNNWTRPLVHRVIAKAGAFSDGEESMLPVLTNRMLVTETQPLPIRGQQTKTFDFERMRTTSKSKTLTHHRLSLEFTQNPAWYALQSLPYLMEYPYECTEQLFSRYYANSLASDVANSHPKIKRVFDQWKNIDKEALKSNLSKNEELKYALLEETPWVLNAQHEETQKQNIGVLFDLNRMGNELAKAKSKIIDRQASNGGFSWMPGGRENWYITQYLVQGFGRLQQLGVEDFKQDASMQNMLKKAVAYIDNEIAKHYKDLLQEGKKRDDEKKYLEANHLSPIIIHYFYARSLFSNLDITNATTKKAIAYYETQIRTYWNSQSRYLQAMLALGLHRWNKEAETVQKIIVAARENALYNEEMGMYWKYTSGYFWYQLPIESHALMIELFDVVAQDKESVEKLKIWLLKAKQTTHWKTTKATAAACYALLRTGDNWLLEDKDVAITIGGKQLDQSTIKKEAGTGYFKTTWDGNAITPKMATIKVSNPNKNVAWGSLYWQYFEDLDKITHFEETPLKLNKKVFKKINTDRGQVIQPIDKTTLKTGDLLTIRVELKVDRAMEYVHMKDMRASGLEPVNVLSQYRYQDGLGYYQSTRDASTNFFFSYLPRGTYVFEYDLRVNHKGEFSNGVTTIQCMYAPEYTAHSEGIRLKVE